MLERIARIVCEKPWHLASSNQKRNAMITAKAVLIAMKEPTEEMFKAGRECEPFDMRDTAPGYKWTPGQIVASSCWRAMIEAAAHSE